jgi:hypothetical protein
MKRSTARARVVAESCVRSVLSEIVHPPRCDLCKVTRNDELDGSQRPQIRVFPVGAGLVRRRGLHVRSWLTLCRESGGTALPVVVHAVRRAPPAALRGHRYSPFPSGLYRRRGGDDSESLSPGIFRYDTARQPAGGDSWPRRPARFRTGEGGGESAPWRLRPGCRSGNSALAGSQSQP